MQLENNRVISFFFLEAIALCLIASLRLINLESTIMLIIFNLLFASLIFQLRGAVNRKLGLLAFGNVIGLLWNFIFCSISQAGTWFFGEGFNVVYAIFYPFLDFMWIVSFWSLSLVVLTTNRRTTVKP
jgi:hypothetical protein